MKIEIEIPEGKKAEWVNGVLTLVDDKPKNITERIKTFEDAFQWCNENGYIRHTSAWSLYSGALRSSDISKCITSYLKLCIITCALNEGWEPKLEEDERKYYPIYDNEGELARIASAVKVGGATPWTLYFKSAELAQYAAEQFADIYADFCGIKKGGEK